MWAPGLSPGSVQTEASSLLRMFSCGDDGLYLNPPWAQEDRMALNTVQGAETPAEVGRFGLTNPPGAPGPRPRGPPSHLRADLFLCQVKNLCWGPGPPHLTGESTEGRG